MHDTTDLETRGLPSVFIATEEFTDAADAQAKALGANPVGVFVAHPIQDRTNEELQALADGVLEKIVTGLTT
ncbi:MAG: hypothetical protein GY937_23505 [bacterium]|nr:hypothetical protein [bacterium]